jgi:Spy/CpxP family protein refolding chaperone
VKRTLNALAIFVLLAPLAILTQAQVTGSTGDAVTAKQGRGPGMRAFGGGMGPGPRGGMLGPGAGMLGPRIQQELGLTEGQVTQLRALAQQQRQATAPLREQMRAQQAELRQLMQTEVPDRAAIEVKLREIAELRTQLTLSTIEARSAFQQVLTPDQREKLKALREQRANQFKNRMGRRGFSPGMRGQRQAPPQN